MKSFAFNTTPSLIFGFGEAERLAAIAGGRLGSRILLVTDAVLVKLGILDAALNGLRSSGIQVQVFDGITPDPSSASVLQAAAQAREFDATGIVGFGGGSSMDVAKLVAVLKNAAVDINDIYGINQVRTPRLPLALVPTTAGTGSEVTPISIVTTGESEKKGVVSNTLLPDFAILDPQLTINLPPAVTAASGVDAMVHAIEAYASANANNNPISQGLAIQALKLLDGSIRQAVATGHDKAARSAMLLGSMLAGQAFANSPVAAVHALAYPLGGLYGVTHGLSNALMLPHILRFNCETHAEVYAEIVTQAFPQLGGGTAAERAAKLIAHLVDLLDTIHLQSRLRDLEIPESACAELASAAMQQTRLLVNNPRPLNEDDARSIYRAAW